MLNRVTCANPACRAAWNEPDDAFGREPNGPCPHCGGYAIIVKALQTARLPKPKAPRKRRAA